MRLQSQYIRLINWSLSNLVLCVLKDTWFNRYWWYINIQLPTKSTLTHEWKKLIEHTIFSLRYNTQPSWTQLRSARHTWADVYTALKQQKYQQKNATKCKICSTKHMMNRTFIYSIRADTRRARISVFNLKRECLSHVTPTFCPSVHAQERAPKQRR